LKACGSEGKDRRSPFASVWNFECLSLVGVKALIEGEGQEYDGTVEIRGTCPHINNGLFSAGTISDRIRQGQA